MLPYDNDKGIPEFKVSQAIACHSERSEESRLG